MQKENYFVDEQKSEMVTQCTEQKRSPQVDDETSDLEGGLPGTHIDGG